MYGNIFMTIPMKRVTMTQVLSPSGPDAMTGKSSGPSIKRVEMSTVSMPVFVLVAFGTMVLGVTVGVLTGNQLFIYEMVGFPLAAIFFFASFASSAEPTRPAVDTESVVLPLVALVVACVGIPVLGIALGHASRHLIASRGGEGEKIALAALIVSYSFLAAEVLAGLWILTALRSLF
jgi:hypothetical protein